MPQPPLLGAAKLKTTTAMISPSLTVLYAFNGQIKFEFPFKVLFVLSALGNTASRYATDSWATFQNHKLSMLEPLWYALKFEFLPPIAHVKKPAQA